MFNHTNPYNPFRSFIQCLHLVGMFSDNFRWIFGHSTKIILRKVIVSQSIFNHLFVLNGLCFVTIFKILIKRLNTNKIQIKQMITRDAHRKIINSIAWLIINCLKLQNNYCWFVCVFTRILTKLENHFIFAQALVTNSWIERILPYWNMKNHLNLTQANIIIIFNKTIINSTIRRLIRSRLLY